MNDLMLLLYMMIFPKLGGNIWQEYTKPVEWNKLQPKLIAGACQLPIYSIYWR